MLYSKMSEIFTGENLQVNDGKYICPNCKNKVLIFPSAIPLVFINPVPRYFMYCNECKDYIAVLQD